MNLFKRIKNRVLFYFSSGSPLRYPRKLAIYAMNFRTLSKRMYLGKELAGSKEAREAQLTIQQAGYRDVTSLIPSDLFEELVAAASTRLSNRTVNNSVKNRKYLGELLIAEDRQVDTIYMRLALQEKILKIAASHLGQTPRLFGLSLLLSEPTGNDWLESQLWHKDYDDSRIIKLFIYVTDVKIRNDGPFTFLPPSTSSKVGRSFIPKRITDQEMAQKGVISSIKEVYGIKGTAFLIDTARCYHLGSRCVDSQRLAYIATYTTNAPLDKRMQFPKFQNLSELTELVVG
jgi:hypothetical protein